MTLNKRTAVRPYTSPTVQNPTYPMVVQFSGGGRRVMEMPWEEASSPETPTRDEGLWCADPDCQYDVRPAPGGGVECSKRPGWFCH